MHHLRFTSGDLKGEVLELPDSRVTFGRENDNIIATDNAAVSSHHAVLVPESGGFVLYDLDSTNGTFVNNQPVKERRLLHGDVVRIGILEFQYELDSASRTYENPPPPAPSEPAINQTEPESPPPPQKSPMRVTVPVKQPALVEETSASIEPSETVVTEIVRERYRDLRIQSEISAQLGVETFVEAARRLSSLNERNAPFVPFTSSWPNYDVMTSDQQRWYFYWRDSVRHEQYPNTDLAYVFLHVYELINQVGAKDVADGFRQLHTLWLRYRGRHPLLDCYLVDWLADYVVVNKMGVNPFSLYFEAFELGRYTGEADLILSQVLNKPDAPLPRRLAVSLSDYPIQYSKFYLGANQRAIDDLVLKVFQLVDTHFRETGGAGIFERFKPSETLAIHRRPFRGALYAGSPEEITIATIIPYSRHKPLREFATALLKHSENCFRDIGNYPDRLASYILPPEIKSLIENFLRANASPALLTPKMPVSLSSDRKRFSHRETVRRILIRCTAAEISLLQRLIRDRDIAEASSRMNLSEADLNEAISRINGLAMKFLGDSLLTQETGTWLFADDYREELQSMFSEPIGGVPGVWLKFLQQLSSIQRRVLAMILNPTQRDEIRQFIGGKTDVLETLLHSINDFARKTLGENLIDTDAIPPTIDNADIEILKTVSST